MTLHQHSAMCPDNSLPFFNGKVSAIVDTLPRWHGGVPSNTWTSPRCSTHGPSPSTPNAKATRRSRRTDTAYAATCNGVATTTRQPTCPAPASTATSLTYYRPDAPPQQPAHASSHSGDSPHGSPTREN